MSKQLTEAIEYISERAIKKGQSKNPLICNDGVICVSEVKAILKMVNDRKFSSFLKNLRKIQPKNKI